MNTPRFRPRTLAYAMLLVIVACTVATPGKAELHRWWGGFGMVVPHESFPADCSLCHVGSSWNKLVPNFRFDHGARTGVALGGVHNEAMCLRCHNDRGPVSTYNAKGCVGCHQDVHFGLFELPPQHGDRDDESTTSGARVDAARLRAMPPAHCMASRASAMRCRYATRLTQRQVSARDSELFE